MDLQPYWSYNDVVQLTLMIEKQEMETRSNDSHSQSKGVVLSTIPPIEKVISSIKSIVSIQSPKVLQFDGNAKLNSQGISSRKCPKYREFGRIASDCANWRSVNLIKKAKEDDDQSEDENITYVDQGEVPVH